MKVGLPCDVVNCTCQIKFDASKRIDIMHFLNNLCRDYYLNIVLFPFNY